MKRFFSALAALLVIASGMLSGCSGRDNGLDPKEPITLTMWHNFGGAMQATMDTLIDEFNSTVGKDKGIIINVTAITSSSELQQALGMIVNGDPGASQMPDITTSYPKTAVLFREKGLAADLDDYFTSVELDAYVDEFIDEGRFGDGGLYVFPFAKSTEILYLNQTLFDRFSAATGVTMDCFATFEGLADAARRYYDWTDSLTPDTPDDGKQFYAADSWVNLAQAGMLQLGGELFADGALNTGDERYRRIWETCGYPSVEGGFTIYDGYSSDLSKTGDLICSTGSSAGILFYGDTITYPDNTTERVEYSILPYPVFEGGEKIAIQRGNGFMVAASDKTREYAASVFLKWFTAPEQNMRFVAYTGYLPVTDEAFEKQMPELIATIDDARIKKMLEAVMRMHEEYTFFVAPTFESFDSLSRQYEKDYKAAMAQSRSEYLSGAEASRLIQESLAAFIAG